LSTCVLVLPDQVDGLGLRPDEARRIALEWFRKRPEDVA